MKANWRVKAEQLWHTYPSTNMKERVAPFHQVQWCPNKVLYVSNNRSWTHWSKEMPAETLKGQHLRVAGLPQAKRKERKSKKWTNMINSSWLMRRLGFLQHRWWSFLHGNKLLRPKIPLEPLDVQMWEPASLPELRRLHGLDQLKSHKTGGWEGFPTSLVEVRSREVLEKTLNNR